MDATELVMAWISVSLEKALEALSEKPIGYVVLLVDGEHTAVSSNLGLELSTQVLREHVEQAEHLMAAGLAGLGLQRDRAIPLQRAVAALAGRAQPGRHDALRGLARWSN